MEVHKLDPKGIEAAVRECARLTAPELGDEAFERHKAEPSSEYLRSKSDVQAVLGAYFDGAGIDACKIEKAALLFDHIQKAREYGKDWWAEGLTNILDIQIEQDRILVDVLAALRAAVDAHDYPGRDGWVVEARAAIAKAEGHSHG